MATSSPPVTGVSLSPAQIAGSIVRNGGRGDGVAIGTAIVLRETGGTGRSNTFRPEAPNQAAYDADPGKYNKPGRGDDRGGWQFNSKAQPEISDADAYNFERATAWAARKSAGFTNFAIWDIGPGAYSGVDKLPQLQSGPYWNQARTAAASPDMSTPATAGTPAATATIPPLSTNLRRFDRNGDGKLTLDADFPSTSVILLAQARAAAGGSDDDVMDLVGVRYTTTQGNLEFELANLDADAAASHRPPFSDITPDQWDAALTWSVITMWQRITRTNLPAGNPIGQGIAEDVVDLIPDWVTGLGRLIGNLLSGSFWRRILIVLGGVALVALAVVLANRGLITSAATKGAIQ